MQNVADSQRRVLKKFMKTHDLTVNGWAKRAGITEGTIRAFLKGNSSSLSSSTLQKMASVCGVTINDLVYEPTEANEINATLLASSVAKVDRIIAKKGLEFTIEKRASIYAAWYNLVVLSRGTTAIKDKELNDLISKQL